MDLNGAGSACVTDSETDVGTTTVNVDKSINVSNQFDILADGGSDDNSAICCNADLIYHYDLDFNDDLNLFDSPNINNNNSNNNKTTEQQRLPQQEQSHSKQDKDKDKDKDNKYSNLNPANTKEKRDRSNGTCSF